MSPVRSPLIERVIAELLEPLDPAFLGPNRYVYCYRPEEGGCPAREFLDSALDKIAKAAYAKSFEFHVNGMQLRGEKHHVWTEKGCDGLADYKHIGSKTRIISMTDADGLIILLCGVTGKKENKIDEVHVNYAKRLRDEYRQRRAAIDQRLRTGTNAATTRRK